jgi:hypothetical protein
VPWANPEVRKAGTVHLDGEQREIYVGAIAGAQGKRLDRLFVSPAMSRTETMPIHKGHPAADRAVLVESRRALRAENVRTDIS